MQKSDLPKNQHFVPQFILRNFCLEGGSQVHVFDKKLETTFLTNVRNIAAENDFYNVDHNGSFFSVEQNLSKLESKANRVVKKIISDKSLAHLSDDDKRCLSFFIAAQYARSKNYRFYMEQLHDFLSDRISDMGYDPDDVEGLSSSDDSHIKKVAVFGLRENILKFMPYILNKTWILLGSVDFLLKIT